MNQATRKLFIISNSEHYFHMLLDPARTHYIRKDVMCKDLCKVITSMLDYFDTEYQIRVNFLHTNFVKPVDTLKYEKEIEQTLTNETVFKYLYQYVRILSWDWRYCSDENVRKIYEKEFNIITETIIDYIAMKKRLNKNQDNME